jgi:hypothetical protein
MATKKKAPAKAAPKSSAKPTTKAPAKAGAHKDSVAVKVLGHLPAIDSRLRAAFMSSFSEEQCETWGTRTKAVDVLKEAVAVVNTLHATLQKQAVGGYSQRRLAFLCEQLVELEDEISVTTSGDGEKDSQRGARASALAVAVRTRNDLSNRLKVIAGGREDLLAQIGERNSKGVTPGPVRDALAGLIDLAGKWRRDPVLELLADDADLTAARLTAAYNAQESLGRTDDVLREATLGGGDAASVNKVEGRVLRELRLAQKAFSRAKESGANVPGLVFGPTLRRGFGEDDKKKGAKPAPA